MGRDLIYIPNRLKVLFELLINKLLLLYIEYKLYSGNTPNTIRKKLFELLYPNLNNIHIKNG